jgi:hypothetical protein
MTYVTAEARQELLDAVAEAIDRIGVALGALGDAYEQLDEHSADRLEDELFRPVQAAYSRATRTHAGFASRYALPTRTFAPVLADGSPRGVRELLDTAVEAVEDADDELATLQDSLKPVEVGDPELRQGLAEVRQILGHLPGVASRLAGRLGR